MEGVITVFLGILGGYYACGILFALYVVLIGVKKIDPQLADSKKSVRALVFPGLVATWPFLFFKMIKYKRK